MKTKEELDKLKEEVESVNEKLAELTEEELEQVTGGINPLHLPNSAKVIIKNTPIEEEAFF